MKKGLLSILLTGLVTLSCSNNKDLFEKISKERTFKIKNYDNYFVKSIINEKKKVVYIGYDLNKNGKMDVLARTNIIKKEGDKYITNAYATVLAIDKNENGIYEIVYSDKDGDGKLETEDHYIKF